MFALKSMHVLSLTNKATCLFCCLESHHNSQELEGMLMLTQGGGKEKEKSRNWDISRCVSCAYAKGKTANWLITTMSTTTWQVAFELVTNQSKESSARQEGNTVQS